MTVIGLDEFSDFEAAIHNNKIVYVNGVKEGVVEDQRSPVTESRPTSPPPRPQHQHLPSIIHRHGISSRCQRRPPVVLPALHPGLTIDNPAQVRISSGPLRLGRCHRPASRREARVQARPLAHRPTGLLRRRHLLAHPDPVVQGARAHPVQEPRSHDRGQGRGRPVHCGAEHCAALLQHDDAHGWWVGGGRQGESSGVMVAHSHHELARLDPRPDDQHGFRPTGTAIPLREHRSLVLEHVPVGDVGQQGLGRGGEDQARGLGRDSRAGQGGQAGARRAQGRGREGL